MSWEAKNTFGFFRLSAFVMLAVVLSCQISLADNSDFFSPVTDNPSEDIIEPFVEIIPETPAGTVSKPSVKTVAASVNEKAPEKTTETPAKKVAETPSDNAPENTPAPNQIYLDSSQVDHPVLKGIFPSPSEYKAKNSVPADIFTPAQPSQEILTRTYKVDNPDNPTKLETVDSGSEAAGQGFSDMNFFAPPSEYKKHEKEIKTVKETKPLPPIDSDEKQLPPIDGDESYYASAEETEEEPMPDIEGKTISDVTVSGLRLMNENTVLNEISSQRGSAFNKDRVQRDLQNIFNTGYFMDNMHVEPTLNEDDTVSLEFIVHENPEVKEVQITGNTVIPANELLAFTKNLTGMPQNLYYINNSIDEINRYYQDKGYILARVTSVEDAPNGTLTLGITEGVIDKISFEGNRKTKDYIIQRNIMTQPGTVYNEEQLKKDLTQVYATKIFEEVNRKIEPSPDYNGEYNVTIVVKEASSNGISIGGGIDNALGVFGSLNIFERNFLGKAQQVNLSGMIGSGLLMSDASIKNRMNYQIELNFKEPHFINADNSLLSKLYLRELGSYDVPLAIERRFGIKGMFKHKVKGNDNLTTHLEAGFENINLREGDFAKIANQYKLCNLDIKNRAKQLTGGDFFNIAPGVQYSTLSSDFMPRDGLIAKASFMESIGVDNIHNSSGRLAGSLTKYIPVFEKSTLIIGAKGGIKVHGDDMPEVMAFRLGGPYTIRGFRMSGVGSGDSFLMGSVELQTPIPFMDRFKYEVLKNLRFAFFMDAGKIWDPTITSTLYDRPCSAITAGVGLRVNIKGMGPIAVDFGLPLTNVGHYNKQHGYFTFGTGGLYDSYEGW